MDQAVEEKKLKLELRLAQIEKTEDFKKLF